MSNSGAARWIRKTLWRYRSCYLESMAATILTNFLTLATIFFTMNVYNRVVPTQAYASLWTLALGTAVAIIFEFAMRLLKARLVDLAGKHADLEINALLLRELFSIRLENRPQSVGAFASSMRDFEALRDFFSSASLVLIADLPFAALFIFLIWYVGGPLVFIPLCSIPILLLAGLFCQPNLTKIVQKNMMQSSDRHAVLVEVLQNLEFLKANNALAYLQHRWDSANASVAETFQKIRGVSSFITGFNTLVQQFTTVGLVVLGVYLIHRDGLSLGGLIAVVMLAGRAVTPFSNIMSLAVRYQQAKQALDTLDHLLQTPRERDASVQLIDPSFLRGAICAQNLSFSYPTGSSAFAIDNVSLAVQQGERIALVGKVGSGKSTLLRLMAGLYTPASGLVTLDDVDFRQLNAEVFRERIAYIGHDPQLFKGTLRNNLRLNRQDITDQAIFVVLDQLGLTNFVSKHPRGLDLPLSEAGKGVSDGLRQLIAIARMLLRDPNLIFLDEPTAHMDPHTQDRVVKVLAPWFKGRTVLLSTHRHELLSWIDRVVVLEDARIFSDRPKEEVLARLARRPVSPSAGSV